MSLAVLKKKTASKYNNNSVGTKFSINGTYRNQGYVGQTSLSRTLIHTPKTGTTPQGHGSCCNTYSVQDIKNSSCCSTEQNHVIKSSVLSTSGMLSKKHRWLKRPHPYSTTKPSDSINQSTSGDYIIFKRKSEIKKANECDVEIVSEACCPPTKAEIPNKTKSQSEYIYSLISECADLDISYIEYSTPQGPPITLC